MAHQVPWTKVILEEFIEQALLTEDEEKIMRTRIAGWSRTKQANEFGMSISTIDKIIHKLKKKYDRIMTESNNTMPFYHLENMAKRIQKLLKAFNTVFV